MKSKIPSNLSAFGGSASGGKSFLQVGHGLWPSRLFLSVFCLLISAALSSGTLQIENGPVSSITASNAVLSANLVSTNTTNAAVTVYYGAGNGGTNIGLWQYSNYFGIVSTGLYSFTTTNLPPATYEYYRARATEGTNTAWASVSSNFMTSSRPPTNYPASTNPVTVMAWSNGVLVTPIDFFSANNVISPTNTGNEGEVLTMSGGTPVWQPFTVQATNENDPIFSAAPAAGISSNDIAAWRSGSNWSGSAATQTVNMANNGFTNVSSIHLGGVTRTTWPAEGDTADWAHYEASEDVDINNYTLFNVGGIELGGIWRNSWPTAPEDWASVPASTNVNLAGHRIFGGTISNCVITNCTVAGVATNGHTHTNYLTNAASWSSFPATQSVNMANHAFQNVSALGLGGVTYSNWPAETNWAQYGASKDVDMVNHGLQNVSALGLGGETRTNWGFCPWTPGEVFNQTGTVEVWSNSVSAPVGLDYYASAVISGSLYVAGGHSTLGGASGRTNLYVFNGTNWTEKKGMSFSAYGTSGDNLSNNFYVIGGLQKPGSDEGPIANASKFDGENWVSLPTLPVGLGRHSVCAYNGHIYTISGWRGYFNPDCTNVYRLDSTNWTEVASLPGVRQYGAAVVYSNCMYYMGGGNAMGWNGSYYVAGPYGSNVFKYDGTSWTEVASLPMTGTWDHISASTDGEKIVVVWGTNTVYYNGSIWQKSVASITSSANFCEGEYFQGKFNVLGGYSGSYKSNQYYLASAGVGYINTQYVKSIYGIDFQNHGLSNVSYIYLGGSLRTNWPDAGGSTSGVSSISLTGAVSGVITFSGPGVTQTNNTFNFSGGSTPGSNGQDGAAATIAIAWVSNGIPGSSVVVTNVGSSNAALFGFIIPPGSNGIPGTNGNNGTNGLAATIGIAWVSNGVPGSAATVTNVGSSNAALFGFVIPAGSNAVGGDLSSTQLIARVISFAGTDFDPLVGTNNPDSLYQFSLTIATNATFTGSTLSVHSTNAPSSWSYWNGATIEQMQSGYLPHGYLNSYSAHVAYTFTNSIRGNTYYCRGYIIVSNPPCVANIINKILEGK